MNSAHLSENIMGLGVVLVAIVFAAIYAIITSVFRSRERQLEIRERIMMIERGLVPPPEVDPQGFEQEMERLGPTDRYARYERYRSRRRRGSGVTMMAVGFGLMVMMYPNFRIGGFMVVMGLFFLFSTLFDSPKRPSRTARRPVAPPPGPPPPYRR